MFEVIRGINEQGITVLLIEHNVFDALSICPRSFIFGEWADRNKGHGPRASEQPRY
jgi:ABC-type lipopolysaccharide export system ATPase subunit